MNEPSPYQPPLPQGPPSIPNHWVADPTVVKVLGITHLVFAGFGLMTACFGAVVALIGNPFLKLIPQTPEMAAQIEAQTAMQTKLMPMQIVGAILSLVIAVPMIIAGIKLLKKRRSGLKWSNYYAWTSISGKAVNLVLAATVLIPAMNEMTHGLLKGGPAMPAKFEGIMSAFAVAGTIISVVVSCTYPVLSLILLNRPAVKQWFARQPI